MTQLVKYEAAKHALAEAKRVDEAKDIADKAMALEAYARQVKDQSLEVMAAEIRTRAKRRVGEISQALEKAKNQHTSALTSSGKSKSETLKEAGISLIEANRCEQLARISEEDFETQVNLAMEDGRPPKMNEIIIAAKQNAQESAPSRAEQKRIKEARRKRSEKNWLIGRVIESLEMFMEYPVSPPELVQIIKTDDGAPWRIDHLLSGAEFLSQFAKEWKRAS